MPDPNTHYFDVVIEISDYKGKVANEDVVNFVMPVWTPGSYLVREFSRNVLDFSAINLDNRSKLTNYKSSKNTWSVETRGASRVEIRYSVYAFELTVDTSYLDNLHGIINGASIFMFIPGMENEPASLEMEPIVEWKKISTGLRRNEASAPGINSFVVPEYDVLVDSPIEIGNQRIHSFDVGGVTHEVSIFSQRHFDQTSFVGDLKKIVASTIPIFQSVPYERYVFIVDFVGDSYGGLEHLNSTHCLAPILRLEPPQEYRELLSLFSHEFFHTWNVKRLRPAGLGPFDYSKETYTRSLWISEGVTSYYDDLILRRASIYSVGEYLEAFSSNINLITTLPGSSHQSAEEASFDTWIKHYRQDENSPNVLSSYYLQGAVIGFMLDMEIRKATDSLKTLDDVLRKIYADTYLKENRGFSDSEFEAACCSIAPSAPISEIFEERVKGRKKVDFGKYLGYAGLKPIPKKKQEPQGFLGVRAKDEGGKIIVSNVLAATPAEDCGLAPFDEIIGVDGLRMDKARLIFYLSNKKPGDDIAMVTSRLGGLLELKARLAEKPVFEYRIVKKDGVTDQEKALFKNWLGQDWDKEIRYEDFSPSPARRITLDYF